MVRSRSTDVRQRLVNRHAGAARIGEDDVDAVIEQALNQDRGSGLQFRLRLTHDAKTPRTFECG